MTSKAKTRKPPSCHHCAPESAGVQKDGAGSSDHSVVQPHKRELLNRLNRVLGQIRGVTRMIEEDRYCVEVLAQLNAAKSALDAVGLQVLEDHTQGCVRNAIRSGKGERELAELMDVVRQFNRL